MTKQTQKSQKAEQKQVSLSDIAPIVRADIDSIDPDDVLVAVGHLDTEEIAADAGEFVYKGVFMGLISQLDFAMKQGADQIDRAQRAVISAINADTGTSRNQKTAENVERRTRWLATQEVQQLLRTELRKRFCDLYQVATGETYRNSRGNSLEQVVKSASDNADHAAAAALLKRRAS